MGIKTKFKPSLHIFNNFLSLIVMGVGLYLVATPWIPQLQLWWDLGHKEAPSYISETLSIETPEPSVEPIVFPDEKRIVIPTIALDSQIYDGPTAAELNYGPWKRPNTSNPTVGGNTVIAGHRFAYGADGKWIFYHLDKLEPGDKIGVYWDKVEYVYQVRGSNVVPPTAIEIEGPTSNDQLTLYTCTPLWTATNRLVVVADLIETNTEEEANTNRLEQIE